MAVVNKLGDIYSTDTLDQLGLNGAESNLARHGKARACGGAVATYACRCVRSFDDRAGQGRADALSDARQGRGGLRPEFHILVRIAS